MFKLGRPGDGASIDKGFELENGDYAVVRLTGVSDADPASIAEATRSQLERGLENIRRSAVISAMTEELRARADIVITEESE